MRIKTILLLVLGFGALVPSAVKYGKPYLEERVPYKFSLDTIALDLHTDFGNEGVLDLSKIENQEFHYIGHGGQAIAFASQDDRYVLKFFLRRQLHGEKRFPIPKPTHWIPSHRKARQEKREQARWRSMMKAMKNTRIAFEKLKEKTGIIGLHFNATEEKLPVITLIDPTGQKHRVDLARASFVFQHKALLVPQKLASIQNTKGKEAAIASLHQFFAERAKEGFFDTEKSFMIEQNYGFIENTPIQLDAGNIEFKESLRASPDAEIERMQKLLSSWIKK